VQDPLVGRFASADPYITEPGFTQTYNRYAYVYNNPLKNSDPSGFEPICIPRPIMGSATASSSIELQDGQTFSFGETSWTWVKDIIQNDNCIATIDIAKNPGEGSSSGGDGEGNDGEGDESPQGECINNNWDGADGNFGDFLSGLGRKFGNDVVDVAKLAASARSPILALQNMLDGPSDFFGSNDTNAGTFGADLVPAVELFLPAVRAKYLASLSQIPRLAGNSARAANAMRNELKWGGRKSYEQLVREGRSDADILRSATKSNFGVNATAAIVAAAVGVKALGCN